MVFHPSNTASFTALGCLGLFRQLLQLPRVLPRQQQHRAAVEGEDPRHLGHEVPQEPVDLRTSGMVNGESMVNLWLIVDHNLGIIPLTHHHLW